METGQKTIQTSNSIDIQSNYILSIQVSLNGLSFCILNLENNTVVYYTSTHFDKQQMPPELLDKITHYFNNETELKNTFKKVTVIHDNELSSLVPKVLFNEEHAADYLKFNSKILRTDFITHDEISSNDSVNVYVPYVNINNYFYDKFGAFEFKHSSTILIEKLLSIHKNSTSQTVYINVNTCHFQIVVLDNNELILYNWFDYSSKEDFIYYILFVLEQLEFNPEDISIELLGNITKEDELYTILYTYVRHVSFLNTKMNYESSTDLTSNINSNIIISNSF